MTFANDVSMTLLLFRGLLQPLLIPLVAWSQFSIDFIEGLPVSSRIDVVMVVVDRLTKYVHFIGLKHPYTAATVAQAYLDNIFKLHGLPNSIVSDRDVVLQVYFGTSCSNFRKYS